MISQNELAKKADISVFYLNKLENGQRNLCIKTAARIAKVLNVSLRDIFLPIMDTNSIQRKGWK